MRLPLLQMIRLLIGNKEALVDLSDFDLVKDYTWYADKGANTYYAVTEHKGKKLRMHRIIMGVEDKRQFVDHIDGNGLNNCRANLRICTSKENNRNAAKFKKATSIYKGVWYEKHCGKWRAHIRVNTKGINLGIFSLEEDAARAYNEAALKYFGKFARLNKI